MSQENFKPSEQFQSGDSGSAESSSKFRNEARESTLSSSVQPGDIRNVVDSFSSAFQTVTDFINKNIGADGKLNVDNLTSKQIRDILDLNQKQVDTLTQHKGKMVSNLDAVQVNLKQFG